jgi:ribonuclease BN (tRNA processing enzyme)
MKVIFLGTNGWYDTATGNTICTLVQTEHCDILLDAGNGIHRAADHIEGAKPVFLFLSHFHIDHIEGLHILAKVRCREGLTICAPAGGRKILGTFINTPFTIPLAALPYPARIIEMPEESASLPFSVEALPLRHASLTLGYRFAIDGRIIGYCPDTGYCENAVKLALASDLLITECAYKEGQSSEAWPHLNPETAARIACEAGAKRLVLTHFDAGIYLSLSDRKESEAVASAIFTATTAATDGLRIDM